MRLEQAEADARHAEELGALRERVAGVLSRFMAGDVSEAGAVAEMSSRGVEVRFVPASSAPGSGEGGGMMLEMGVSFLFCFFVCWMYVAVVCAVCVGGEGGEW